MSARAGRDAGKCLYSSRWAIACPQFRSWRPKRCCWAHLRIDSTCAEVGGSTQRRRALVSHHPVDAAVGVRASAGVLRGSRASDCRLCKPRRDPAGTGLRCWSFCPWMATRRCTQAARNSARASRRSLCTSASRMVAARSASHTAGISGCEDPSHPHSLTPSHAPANFTCVFRRDACIEAASVRALRTGPVAGPSSGLLRPFP